jgi:twitching motility protein PilT
MEIDSLLKLAMERTASDLHITSGAPPILRIDGKLTLTDLPVISSEESKRLVYSILAEEQKKRFEKDLELDFSVTIPGAERVRANLHLQRGNVEAAFRLVPATIKTIKELGLPKIVTDLARKAWGMVLVTGPTGVGKTTTLAAMVDQINEEKEYLVVTVEDPIEYVHLNKKSVIKQREVYADTHSFSGALRHILRQDPNVIVIGEMRDLETIGTALTAAETGHLVLASLHTPDAPQTIDRIIDIFPPYQQNQVMVQLSNCLQGIISQRLLPKKEGGRVVACETMIATSAVRNLIRSHETAQLRNVIQTGAQYGMVTMDASVKALYHKGLIDLETAKASIVDFGEISDLEV